jgi:hypothetical protein
MLVDHGESVTPADAVRIGRRKGVLDRKRNCVASTIPVGSIELDCAATNSMDIAAVGAKQERAVVVEIDERPGKITRA